MDATMRPLNIPPEIANYAEKHGLFDLYKRILSELLIVKPADPLDYMINFLRREDDDVPRIVLLGPPAAGKGSIARMFSKTLGVTQITMDGLLSGDQDLAHEAQMYIDQCKDIPADIWAKLVHSRVEMFDAAKKGWVLDSVVQNRDQVLALCALGVYPKHCLLLHAPDSVLVERASGKRVDPETGDVYHVTFDWPSNIEVANRLQEVPGCNDSDVTEQLNVYHRTIDGIKACYDRVLKVINVDQPKTDVFSQVMSFVCQQPRSAAPHTPRVILIGPSGSGRATLSATLAAKYRLVHVSCSQLIRQAVASNSSTGHACKSYVDKGLPVPDAMVLQIIKDRLSQLDCVTRGWILYGYPRTRDQAQALQDAGFTANRIFFFDISNEAILERCTLRTVDPMTGNQYHLLYNPPRTQQVKDRLQTRPNDSIDAIMAALSEYHANREDLYDFYSQLSCHRVNADQDVHTIFETLETLIVNPLPKCPQTL